MSIGVGVVEVVGHLDKANSDEMVEALDESTHTHCSTVLYVMYYTEGGSLFGKPSISVTITVQLNTSIQSGSVNEIYMLSSTVIYLQFVVGPTLSK